MGVDLRLLPVDVDQDNNFYAHDIISVERDYFAFDAINALKRIEPTSKRFLQSFLGNTTVSGVRSYGNTMTCAYSKPIEFVDADALAACFSQNPNAVLHGHVIAYLRKRHDMAVGSGLRHCLVGLFWH